MDIWCETLFSVDLLKASAVVAKRQIKESDQYGLSLKLSLLYEMLLHTCDWFDNNLVTTVKVNRSLTCDS